MPESKLVLPDGAVYVVKSGDVPEKWDGETVAGVVLKSDDERRYTLTMGYPADMADVARARDGFRDFAGPAEVEKAAWGFMRNGAQVGAYHADGTEGAGETVESYIYRGPDWTLTAADGSTQVVKAGDWLIGTIWDEPTWDGFKKGELGGTSMQGEAKRRTPNPADVARVKARRG